MGTNSFFSQEERSRRNRYFSEDLKKRIVRDLERNFVSIPEIVRVHHVSRTSIYRWIYKYSAMAKKQYKQIVEPKSDTQRIKMLEERIKELERLLGQKQILLEFNEKMIEIAEETYQIEIKKKAGSRPSSGTTSTGKKSK